MRIKPETLARLTTPNDAHFTPTVQRYYCTSMTVINLCDGRCEITCGDRLRELFARYRDTESREDIRKPYGFASWLCIDAVAKAQEDSASHVAKVRRDKYGVAIGGNPFERIANEAKTQKS